MRGYHVVNTLIHLANALLIYLLVRITVRRDTAPADLSPATGLTPYLPLLAAILFVVHPLQTQCFGSG